MRVLRDLALVMRVVDLSGRVVQLALNDDAFRDFENALQSYSAAKLSAMSAAEFLNVRG